MRQFPTGLRCYREATADWLRRCFAYLNLLAGSPDQPLVPVPLRGTPRRGHKRRTGILGGAPRALGVPAVSQHPCRTSTWKFLLPAHRRRAALPGRFSDRRLDIRTHALEAWKGWATNAVSPRRRAAVGRRMATSVVSTVATHWKRGVPRWGGQTSNLARVVNRPLVGSTPTLFRRCATAWLCRSIPTRARSQPATRPTLR